MEVCLSDACQQSGVCQSSYGNDLYVEFDTILQLKFVKGARIRHFDAFLFIFNKVFEGTFGEKLYLYTILGALPKPEGGGRERESIDRKGVT